jgi:hypothetical protein
MKHALILTFAATAMLMGGCPTNPTDGSSGQGFPAGSDTQEGDLPECERDWHDESIGVGVNPPEGAAGPTGNPLAATPWFVAEWTGQDGRIYSVAVQDAPGSTLEAVVQFNRDVIPLLGGTVLEDRALEFANGETGWVLIASAPAGTLIDAFYYRDGRLFDVGVGDVSGATEEEWRVINDFIESLCVDP